MFDKNILILSVDDMESARLVMKTNLVGLGFNNIIEARDGKTALDMFNDMNEIGSPIELIISDWVMPTMSGLDLLIKVRSLPAGADLPFLMVTAEGDAPQVVKAIQAGVTDYIVKPFSSELFYRKLMNVWNKTAGRLKK